MDGRLHLASGSNSSILQRLCVDGGNAEALFMDHIFIESFQVEKQRYRQVMSWAHAAYQHEDQTDLKINSVGQECKSDFLECLATPWLNKLYLVCRMYLTLFLYYIYRYIFLSYYTYFNVNYCEVEYRWEMKESSIYCVDESHWAGEMDWIGPHIIRCSPV